MRKKTADLVRAAESSHAELRGTTGLTTRLRQFARNEDGNITVLSIFMFVGIVGICGVGVDLMMNEMKRTKLQHTLDRAILAAADLDQQLEPVDVVQDYFAKSGMASALTSVTKDEGLNYRTVTATASYSSDPLFIGALGVEELVAPASGTAEERVGKVEISMVLDISGSMGFNGGHKLANLKTASQQFLSTVLANEDNGGLTTVSVVPYNHTVNMGSTLAPEYNLSNQHNYSNCATFPTSEFTSLGISQTLELERLSHMDVWNYSWSTTSISSPLCPRNDYAEIKVHQTSYSSLLSHINSLNAGGNTAIDMGMKWGLAMLDPDTQPVVDSLINQGEIIDAASGRPAEYDDREAMKIVVLMTDGENTTQYNLPSSLRSGMSDFYVDERGTSSRHDDRYSVLVRDWSGTHNDRYYWERYRNYSHSYRYRNYPDGGSNNVRRLSYAELFDRFDVYTPYLRFLKDPYYQGYLSYSDISPFYYAYTSMVDADSADSRLATLCDTARNTGVTVYAIAFEAPQRGVTAMQQCASTASHFFDVEGVEITDTFAAIASTINQLRLTQ